MSEKGNVSQGNSLEAKNISSASAVDSHGAQDLYDTVTRENIN